LGLYIVKNLIEILNGKITLESKENIGTEIHLDLSFALKPDENIIISKKENKKLKKSMKSIKILIVEDNKINQLVTKKIIEKNNFLATVVDDGFQAIKEVEINKYDLILMDINMPEINGFETAIRIKKTNPNMPIIALTATDVNEIKSKISQSEIDEVIVKPFDENELVSIIYKYLK
jgi:CheY-like chemotaxis protein